MPKVSHYICVEDNEKYKLMLAFVIWIFHDDSLASHMKTISDEGYLSAAAVDVAAWGTKTSCGILTSEFLAWKVWGSKPE